MEASRLIGVRINLPGEQVEITQQERDALLEELCFVAHCKPIRERFETVGASRPVELADEQRAKLQAVLEGWGTAMMLPEGIRRLLAALTRSGSGF